MTRPLLAVVTVDPSLPDQWFRQQVKEALFKAGFNDAAERFLTAAALRPDEIRTIAKEFVNVAQGDTDQNMPTPQPHKRVSPAWLPHRTPDQP